VNRAHAGRFVTLADLWNIREHSAARLSDSGYFEFGFYKYLSFYENLSNILEF